MTALFRRKTKSKIQFCDFEGQPLKEGDIVMSMRYDMGESRIIKTEEGLVYESLSSGQTVGYARMIDAATGYQKVRKLES